jgi:hypothetical protein
MPAFRSLALTPFTTPGAEADKINRIAGAVDSYNHSTLFKGRNIHIDTGEQDMKAGTARVSMIALVVVLDMPLDRQRATVIDRLIEQAKHQGSRVFWRHDVGQEHQSRNVRDLTVAESHFYLQKLWGG